MALNDDLQKEVAAIFKNVLETRAGQKVPETDDITLGTQAVTLDATVLYADLAESTALVDKYPPYFASEIYKTYLHCASKIIRAQGGTITAFDGDRVMGVFIGDNKNTTAVRCALNINHAVTQIINPTIQTQYAGGRHASNANYQLKHAVGVDTSKLFVARTGIRGSNDLVWVGRAANYAAKLCSLRNGNYASFITSEVYKNMNDQVKFCEGKNMWNSTVWKDKNVYVYCSSWRW